MPLLTRSDFQSAVKDALRHYSQADLLAENALLRTRLLTHSEAGVATPQALRALLAETAQSLFVSERDLRLYRVLDLTYLNPAPKQEAAADRLGLSFSTYRRHLTAVVDRLTEWLWQREQEALRAEAVGGQTTGFTTPIEEPVVLSQRPRLSIVILPFLNLSQDPGVDYLVDGIGDSLITDLSRALPGSFVISRSTAFTYKGRQVTIRQVGRELGVRYVLEGSVLAEPRRVRVNVQLIDALSDEHLWAERFDKERKDILEVQDEIVARLSRSVGLEMVRSEAARGSPSSGGAAIDLVMRGRALANDIKRRENAARAVELFRQALEFDPDNVDALVGIAALSSYQVMNLYRLDEREALLDEAEVLLSRAAGLAPDHNGVLKARALLLRARGQFADAVLATAAVIARNPGEPTCYKEMGLNKLYLGETQQAAEWFRRADAIAPRDPDRWTWLQGLGRALMQLGQDDEAVDALSQAMESNPGYLRGKAWLAAAEALAGDVERAGSHLAEYLTTEPEMTVRRFAEERSSVPLELTSQVYQNEIERILDGLRRAGMPDVIDGRPLRSPRSETTRPAVAPKTSKDLSEPVSQLIGREAELSEVADLMRTHRLVTLIGEGGVGKTRLAIEVARQLLPEFTDGARVAELAPLSDPELVPVTIATSFGLNFAAGAILAERVAKALGTKRLTLVLDNCEHVIDAAASMAAALLHTNPAIRVLATSREPLRTEGEYLYRVPPLAVPAESTHDTEELLRHGAVRLFVTRARAADPHLSPDGRTAAVAAAICRRLDGIPLAIELAAARGAALGIAELASRLDDRFHLLTSGQRTAPPRHQTLRATFDWSYELLPEPERMVLRRLAIFAGSFGLKAAGAIAASTEIAASAVVDCVASLVTKSFVTADIGDAGEHYRLLETTRAYALEKLIESSEVASIGRRHAEYYRDLFEKAGKELETRPVAEWLAAYKPRIENVRAALDWAFSPDGDASVGVALTVVAVPLWMHLSLLDECRGRVEQALSTLRSRASGGTREEMQLYAALGASLIYTKGPAPESDSAWTNALQIAEKLNDTECQLRALRGLWAYRLNSGEFRAALTLAARFCSLATNPADLLVGERMTGTSLHYLGDQINARHHIELMLDGCVTSVHRLHPIRFQFDQSVTARATLARILCLQGFPDQGIQTAQSSLEDAKANGHELLLCNVLVQAACPLALFVGDLAAAELYVAMLIEHSGKHGLTLWHLRGRCYQGLLLNMTGDTAAGLQLLGTALDELRETAFAGHYMMFLGAFAEALGRAGQIAQGLVAIEEALARSNRTEARWYLAELLRLKGELVLLQGASGFAAAAQDHFLTALDWARRQGALAWELRTATSLARLYDKGRTEEARELLAPIYNRFTEGFGTADLIAAKALLDALGRCPSPERERGPDSQKWAGAGI